MCRIVFYNKINRIHRMSMLSDLSNRLQMSTITDAVTDMYHTMYDKLNKVKDVFSKDPEILPNKEPIKEEGYVDPPIKTPESTIEIMKAIGINIKNTVWEYIVQWFIIIVSICLASLVANDMIIYASPIRAFFFVFTLFFSITFLPCAFLVGFYYLLKKGYDLYNYYLSSVEPKPPKSFPMIFAILPITTHYSNSQFIRFLLWAFAYQKSPHMPERMIEENVRLEEVMKNYWNDLNSSFEYIAKIEKTPPFSTLYNNIKAKLTIKGMHPIQIPGYPFPQDNLQQQAPPVLSHGNAQPEQQPFMLPQATPQPLPPTISSAQQQQQQQQPVPQTVQQQQQ